MKSILQALRWESCNVLVKMKLIVIILVVAAGLQVNANGFAQNTVTLSERNSSLIKVFKQIKKQTGYSYILTSELLAQSVRVNIEVTNANLKDALDIIFREQPLAYSIIGKTIVVKEREEPKKVALAGGSPIDVRGRVVNEKGEPVEGVTVTVRGTKKATSTNTNGEFSLSTIDPEAILVFTSVNMETFEVAVSGKMDLVVNLKTRIAALGDVIVVNTGYQTLKPNEVTGSVVLITKEQLDQRVAPDIISKLEGITNGLVFNKKATDGGNELRIRGESTIFGYTEPLIVIDNFPYDGNINEINPNDIENITILKDAAAASIWGVRAGNGVIVITTRKGKANQPLKIELNVNSTVGKKPDLFYSPIINPSDFIDLEVFLFGKGKYSSDLINADKRPVSPVVEILNNRKLGLISSADSASQINALRNNDWRNEYLRYIYRTAVFQQYQMNISGGSSKMNYYFSLGYDKGLQSIVGNENNRITLNNRTSYRPVQNLEFQFGVGYSENTVIGNGFEIISNLYPYMNLADGSGNPLSIPQHRVVWEDTIAKHGFLNWKYYPLQDRDYHKNESKAYTTRLSTSVRYSIIKGLNVEGSYQYIRSLNRAKRYDSEQSYKIRNQINRFAIINNGNYTGSNYPLGGELNLESSDLVSHNARFKIDYERSWNQHSITAIGGYEVREVRGESNGSRFMGYDDENGSFVTPNTFTSYSTYPSGTANLGGGTAFGLSYSGTMNRFRSFFSNALYIFKDKYSISASARLDQANLFGANANKKGTPLWSAGARWDLSKEKFYHLKTIPNLSLRATYGYNGNVSPDLAAVVTIRYAGNASYSGLPYAIINNVPNPELRWEKTAHMTVGLNFGVKGNWLIGSVDYFRKKGKDLIGTTFSDPTTGVSTITGNFSDMETKGLDLSLTSKNINKTFQWSTSVIFNYAKEIVTRYDLPPTSIKNAYFGTVKPIQGYPLRSIFSYRWAGLDPATGDPLIYLADTINKTYTSGTLNSITFNDYVYSGRYNPPFTGSFYNSFSWKGLNLGVNITYKLGHYFKRQSINYSTINTVSWKEIHKDFGMRWQKPGDEKFTNVPSFLYPINTSRDALYNDANILIEKADHIRLQFINLNYSLPKNILQRLRLSSLNVYLYINNIGILWRANDKGIDPDYPYMSYPPSRSYSFGIKAGF